MRLTALLTAAVLFLAGCTGPEGAPGDGSGPSHYGLDADPEHLTVPTWQAGDSWSYLGENGVWQNWTVEGREEKNGFDAYRVRIDWSRPDAWGTTSYTRWFEARSFGVFGEQRSGLEQYSDCPLFPLFPMVNTTQTCTVRITGYGTQSIESRTRVLGTMQVEAEAGRFDAVRLEKVVDHADGSTNYGWYHPAVENEVQFTYDRGEDGNVLYRLVAWNA